MNFKFFASEEARFAAATEVLDSVETMREYFGLDLTRVITIVVRASKIVAASKMASGSGKVQNSDISTWLQQNVTWRLSSGWLLCRHQLLCFGLHVVYRHQLFVLVFM